MMPPLQLELLQQHLLDPFFRPYHLKQSRLQSLGLMLLKQKSLFSSVSFQDLSVTRPFLYHHPAFPFNPMQIMTGIFLLLFLFPCCSYLVHVLLDRFQRLRCHGMATTHPPTHPPLSQQKARISLSIIPLEKLDSSLRLCIFYCAALRKCPTEKLS